MRLIDRDKLLNHIGAVFNKYPEYREAYEMVRCEIRHSREVNAIPVEWIQAWGDHFINDKGFYTGDGYDTIWDMLEAWEGIECNPGMTRLGDIKENVK